MIQQNRLSLNFPLLAATAVGGLMGILALVVGQVPAKWGFVIVLATAAPAVALLVNDLRKLILVVMVIDVPLGIDLAIDNRLGHMGGPTGYLISLSTLALMVGYAQWLVERKPKPRLFLPFTLPALIYLFTVVLSFFQARDLQLSAFGLFSQVQVFLMAFYVANHLRSWEDVGLVVNVFALLMLIEGALMIAQYYLGIALPGGGLISLSGLSVGSGGAGVTGARVAGTMSTPSSAALFLGTALILTLSALLSGKLIANFLAIPALIIGAAALTLTYSRGGWLAFGFGLLVILVRVLWTEAGRRAVILLFGNQIQQRLETLFSDSYRIPPAAMAFNIIEENPLGVGTNNYDLYMIDRYSYPSEVGHIHYTPHNKYLLEWAELGPLGLAAFLLLLISPIWQSRHWLFKSRIASFSVVMGMGVLGALSAHIVHMSGESFAAGGPVLLLWLLIAMLIAVNQLIMYPESSFSSKVTE